MLDVKIRRASLSDSDETYSLIDRLSAFAVSEKTKCFSKKELKKWIKKKKDNIILIAIHNGAIVGFLFAKLLSPEWCMLDSIGVDPKYRKLGVGNKLLEKLYSIVKKVGYVQCLVDIRKKSVRQFWKKRGFKEGNTFVWIEKYF